MKKLMIMSFLYLAGLSPLLAQLWKPLENGLPGEVITTYSNGRIFYALYNKGLNERGKVFGIGMWDGNIWKFLPDFVSDSSARIQCMALYKDGLYIGGRFRKVNNLSKSSYLIRWNGNNYESALQNAPIFRNDFSVNALQLYKGHLIIAGVFSDVFARNTSHIVRWNGSEFLPFNAQGKGFNGPINDLLLKDDSLFVAGAFTAYNNSNSDGLAVFMDTSLIETLNPGKTWMLAQWGNEIVHVSQKDKTLYIGSLRNSEVLDMGLENIYFVSDLLAFDGRLYLCGLFDNADSEKRFFLQYMNGSWVDIGANDLNVVRKLNLFRNDLVISGSFKAFRNVNLHHVAVLENSFGLVQGRIYFDRNNNCTFDQRDVPSPYMLLEVNPGAYLLRTDLLGNYRAFLPEGNYTLRPVLGKRLQIPDCAEESMDIALKEGEALTALNFPITLKPNRRDMQVEITSSQGFRAIRGREQLYRMSYTNVGSLNSGPGKLELRYVPELQLLRSNPPADTIEGGRAVWNFQDINPGEENKVEFVLDIPQALIEDEIQLQASVSTQLADDDPEDNQSELGQTLSEEEQFNSKQVYTPGGHSSDYTFIDASTKEVHYFINFGNFSSDTVSSVVVIDTIDLNLDLRYIQETGASHPYSTQLVNGPPGSNIGIIIWRFDDIHLLPNPNRINDMPGYNGYMSFKIGLKDELPEGTKISNRAQIVYDYHSEFGTNEVVCEISELMHTTSAERTVGTLKLYPNPAGDQIHISSKEAVSYLRITNSQGKTLREESIPLLNAFNVNTGNLANGLYYIEAGSRKSLYRAKVLVAH